jgi:lipoyl(octanoyl) transferase
MPDKKITRDDADPGVVWRVSQTPVPYPDAVAEMERLVADIREGDEPETVWLLEHPPIYTAGTSAKQGDLLAPGRFPVYQTGRGGQYTYHGPGQRIAYLMLDLNRRGKDVRRFVCQIERWIIEALAGSASRGMRAMAGLEYGSIAPEKGRARRTRSPRSGFGCAAGSLFTASA